MNGQNLNAGNRQRGLTVIELMVGMVLGVVLVGGILSVHLAGRAAHTEAERLSRMQENVRFASDYMIRDIRNAGFRDETKLKVGHEAQISTGYASVVNSGSTLRVRYAGRGHCTEAFDTFRLVENEYSVSNGQLVCRGRSVLDSASGATLITAQDWGSQVALVDGISGMAFQLICPDGGTSCGCDIATDLDNACIGVRVGLQFEAARQFDGTALENRAVELTAAFRNVILERVNAAAEEALAGGS